jgi:hypothetical protein
LRSENCRDLVFIGTLVRPAHFLKFGSTGVRFAYLPRVWRHSGAETITLLSGIGGILEQDGFPDGRNQGCRP